MSRYTPEVRKVFKTMPAPVRGFVCDVAEYPNTLTLRFYENNVRSFSEGQKVALSEYLYRLRDTIRDLGTPCELEGVVGDPPNAKK